jgi:hypothetical protein
MHWIVKYPNITVFDESAKCSLQTSIAVCPETDGYHRSLQFTLMKVKVLKAERISSQMYSGSCPTFPELIRFAKYTLVG